MLPYTVYNTVGPSPFISPKSLQQAVELLHSSLAMDAGPGAGAKRAGGARRTYGLQAGGGLCSKHTH